MKIIVQTLTKRTDTSDLLNRPVVYRSVRDDGTCTTFVISQLREINVFEEDIELIFDNYSTSCSTKYDDEWVDTLLFPPTLREVAHSVPFVNRFW